MKMNGLELIATRGAGAGIAAETIFIYVLKHVVLTRSYAACTICKSMNISQSQLLNIPRLSGKCPVQAFSDTHQQLLGQGSHPTACKLECLLLLGTVADPLLICRSCLAHPYSTFHQPLANHSSTFC